MSEETNANEEVNYEELRKIDPMVIFKMMAEAKGIQLRDPKSGCKHCHGTGCRGRKPITGEPIPCSCILPTFDNRNPNISYATNLNRAERRRRHL